MRDFLRGISTIPPALRLLAAPGLRRFVWGPIGINAVVFVGLFVLGYSWLQELLLGWLPAADSQAEGGWLTSIYNALAAILTWLLVPLYMIVSAVVAFFSFTVVANLIACPFNGMLSARVEEKLTGHMPEAIQERGAVVEIIGAIGDECRKLAYFALWLIPLLLVLVIPVINLLATPVWLAAGAWMMTLEYMDYPLGNRGLSFPEQRRRVRQRSLYHLGLGSGLLAMTLIPGLNLIAMPTGVIAATILHQGHDALQAQKPNS